MLKEKDHFGIRTKTLHWFICLFIFYCAGCEYIVAFTKVLTMYQIDHTWTPTFHCSTSPPSPDSWNSINKYNFCIYIHVYTLLAPYSSPYPSSHHFPSPQWCQSPQPRKNLFHPSVLWFCRRKNIKDKMRNMKFLLIWDKCNYTGSLLVIFPCIYAL
jgi:hypothetical protein